MSLQEFLTKFFLFFYDNVIGLLVAIAFIAFLFNIARYFIIQNQSDTGHAKAKRNALYGILAFVIILSLWGIVNLFVQSFGFNRTQGVSPDYFYTAPSNKNSAPSSATPSNTSNSSPTFNSVTNI